VQAFRAFDTVANAGVRAWLLAIVTQRRAHFETTGGDFALVKRLSARRTGADAGLSQIDPFRNPAAKPPVFGHF
jgi:hypothetical protein